MKTQFILLAFLLCFNFNPSFGTILKPGFDAQEYYDMLKISLRQIDSTEEITRANTPKDYQFIYRSPEVGMKNRWDFFLRNDSVGIISVRGTVHSGTSWLENFYSAMLPANGQIKLNDSTNFKYHLADKQNAYVHTGWLLGLAHIEPSVTQIVNEYYKRGIKEFIIIGHSQGAAISFLLTSYLHYSNDIPKDIVFKTYCSGAPKPGNMYYAYDFDFITRGGWAFRIVNTEDWIPESPISVQTSLDYNEVNPFVMASKIFKSQPLMARLYLQSVYNKMDRATKKATKKLRKYLGYKVHGRAKKVLPQLQDFNYEFSCNYSPAGIPIILMPDENYFKLFPFDGQNIFVHHMFKPYVYLLKKDYVIKE